MKLLDAIDSLNEANKLAKDAFDSCKSVDGESNYPIKVISLQIILLNRTLEELIKFLLIK